MCLKEHTDCLNSHSILPAATTGAHEDKLKQIAEILKRQQNKGNDLKNAVTIQTILHTIHLLATTLPYLSQEKILAIDKIFFNKDGSSKKI